MTSVTTTAQQVENRALDRVRGTPVEQFQRDGFMVIRGLADAGICEQICEEVSASLEPLAGPAEYEADTGYVGAPSHRHAPGGNTPRRLLQAYSRNELFRRWASSEAIRHYLAQVMGTSNILLTQCHHNCVMTKHPGYSSETSWHQDIRYWSYDRPELVSVWLALGNEHHANGALQVIAGTHSMEINNSRLDDRLFLRVDLEENQLLLNSAEMVELQMGDVLFFHSRLMHAAGMNQTDSIKTSLVFTYHAADNFPTPGTRSSLHPSIAL